MNPAALQPELDFAAAAERPAAAERLPELIAALRGQGWQTRRQLELKGFAERELRAIVEHDDAGEIVSFPGSPGYILFDEATLPELRRADALKRQGRAMIRRWLRYQRRLHRRGVAVVQASSLPPSAP